jgi:hypothetical protein
LYRVRAKRSMANMHRPGRDWDPNLNGTSNLWTIIWVKNQKFRFDKSNTS